MSFIQHADASTSNNAHDQSVKKCSNIWFNLVNYKPTQIVWCIAPQILIYYVKFKQKILTAYSHKHICLFAWLSYIIAQNITGLKLETAWLQSI